MSSVTGTQVQLARGPDDVHLWMDQSTESGKAGYGVCFPFGEYENIGEPMVGPHLDHRAKASAIRHVHQHCKRRLYLDS